MSASKITPLTPPPSHAELAKHTSLDLAAGEVYFRKNGIEFRTGGSIPVWTEMTVDLHTAQGQHVACTGVVVACSGNRHTGYLIAMVFTDMSPAHQRQMDEFAFASTQTAS
jgi:c-di-GMP-binding flagellar brake protein YcgR